MDQWSFERLLARVRSCRICEEHLPLGPRPILRGRQTARLLIVGQAPGRKVHATGIPWNDPSGNRLRSWMQLDHEQFYDEKRIAIIPTGLCYPGRLPGRGGDRPPRPECAPTWHPELRSALPDVRLTLLIGSFAQAYYLGNRVQMTLAETVASWRDFLPEFLPLPHPSPHNVNWLKLHPWFEGEIVPELQQRVRLVPGGEDHS